MTQPLMPKATAVWLVDNTSLTFDQIADFCSLHPLEVRGIADGEVAQGIKGLDPIATGQLTRDEIEKGEQDAKHKLKIAEERSELPQTKRRVGPRYMPVSRRQDRPDAILWLVRNHGELSDGQIMRLVGTTKPTIQSIRERTHWNAANLKPVDPVTLGLCTQIELDDAVRKAAAKVERQKKKEAKAVAKATIVPTDESLAPETATTTPEPEAIEADESPAEPKPAPPAFQTPEPKPEKKPLDAETVFGNFKSTPQDGEEDDKNGTAG